MDISGYKDKINNAIAAQKKAKDADKDCTFRFLGKDVRMYAVQGSVTGAKAAAQAFSVDVGIAEVCVSGFAYGLGVAGFEPCFFDNSLALQRWALEGAELNAWMLENIMEMVEKKDYVSLQKAGLMNVHVGVELNN